MKDYDLTEFVEWYEKKYKTRDNTKLSFKVKGKNGYIIVTINYD